MDPSQTPSVVAFPESAVDILDAFLRGLPSEATRRVYRRAVQDFGEYLGAQGILSATRRDVEAYRAHLESVGRSASTVCKAMSALAGFFEFGVEEGALDRNPAASARRPKLSDVSPRRGLTPAEVHSMLAVPDASTLVGLRDRALVTVLAVQGWRISEALGLRVEDLAEEQGQKVATITGKGGKVCRVPLAAPTWQSIATWTEAAGIATGPIFVAVLKGGRLVPRTAMSPQAAWKRIRFLAVEAGITRPIHPHLFRHGAVTAALAAGVPLHQVQDFARHADPRTTRRYDSHRQSLANPTPHVLAAAMVPPAPDGASR